MKGHRPRPRVFVSSTIYDFKDLRSALKYWLEELGFDVALSEITDFPRRPDQATFDSCFQAMDDSDYYVLMIGERIGSEYEPGVSVTRAEFRHALKRAHNGHVKLALFVRSEVKSKLRERRATIASANLAGIGSTDLVSSLEGADEIQSFIDEIGAARPPSPDAERSGAPWLYEFANFREIADALRQIFRITGSIRRQALLTNLKAEIERNIVRLCTNSRGIPSAQHEWIRQLRDEVELTVHNIDGDLRFPHEKAMRLGMFYLGGYSKSPLNAVALSDCLRSGEFLEYDPITGEMEAGTFHQRLSELQEWISIMTLRAEWLDAHKNKSFEVVAQLSSKQTTVTVSGQVLLATFALYDATENVLRLLVTLYRMATQPDETIARPLLRPSTPILGQEEGLRAEKATVEDVRAWLDDPVISSLYLNEQLVRQLTEQEIETARKRFPYLGEIIDEALEEGANEFLRGERAIRGMRWDPESRQLFDEKTGEPPPISGHERDKSTGNQKDA